MIFTKSLIYANANRKESYELFKSPQRIQYLYDITNQRSGFSFACAAPRAEDSDV